MIHYIAQITNCAEGSTATNCLTKLPEVAADQTTLTSVLSIVFGALAAVAVLIIVLQGIRFILSSGEPQKASDARRGVIYAVIGLVVALTAEAIVRFFVGRI
ncbi:MAG: pilin [bacterium]